jgi:hypothetical protein
MKALCALLVSLPALAATPFDGTWVSKPDAASFGNVLRIVSLDKGVWSNESLVPPTKVKADGTDQPDSGHASWDTVAAKAVGPDAVQVITKKAGKTTAELLYTVSADGKTMTWKINDLSGTTPATMEVVFARVASGPAGSHPVSGSWQPKKITESNAANNTVTYRSTPDGLSMSSPTGTGYDAKFDGKDSPVTGDIGGAVVSLKKVNANTVVETYKRMGKTSDISTMTVAPDGKTMKVDWEARDSHLKGTMVLEKAK